MKNLVLHIRYLLTQHDCVVVPGWGALVVQHTSASFDSKNQLLPPRRWLSFNALLTHNDGMLAHSLMRANKCSYEEAMSIIAEQVATWRDELKAGNIVEWDRVGSYEYQSEGSLLFTEAENCEVNAAMSMHQPIALTHLADLLHTLPEDEVENEDADETPATITWHSYIWQSVASVAAIVLLMLCISTPIDNYQATNDYASLVTLELLGTTTDIQSVADDACLNIEPTVETPEVLQDNQPEISENKVAAEPVNTPVAEVAAEPVKEIPTEVLTETSLPRYILVVGSLPTRQLAEKQIQEFRQQGVEDNINIYESNGKFRLYINGYNTKQEAEAQLGMLTAQSQSPFAGIWICSTK